MTEPSEEAVEVTGKLCKRLWGMRNDPLFEVKADNLIFRALHSAADQATQRERERAAEIARSFIKKVPYANTCLDIASAIRRGETEEESAA